MQIDHPRRRNAEVEAAWQPRGSTPSRSHRPATVNLINSPSADARRPIISDTGALGRLAFKLVDGDPASRNLVRGVHRYGFVSAGGQDEPMCGNGRR